MHVKEMSLAHCCVVCNLERKLAVAVAVFDYVSRLQRVGFIQFLCLLNERLQTLQMHRYCRRNERRRPKEQGLLLIICS